MKVSKLRNDPAFHIIHLQLIIARLSKPSNDTNPSSLITLVSHKHSRILNIRSQSLQ